MASVVLNKSILVKHDNDYREERLDDAEERGQIPEVPDS